MKVSIVVPVYNEQEYIHNLLDSLVAQEEKADEIIIVDNNSTDQTVAIAQKYPVTLIKEKKQGITPTRNRGFNKAKYDLIVRTDADVIAPPDWIKRIKMNFRKYKIDALYGPVIFYDLPLKSPAYAVGYFDFIKQLQKGKESSLYGPNMMITKEMWNKVKSHLCDDDKQVHEDHDLGIHINELGGTIRRDPKLIIQTSARRMLKQPKSFFLEYPTRLYRTLMTHRKI